MLCLSLFIGRGVAPSVGSAPTVIDAPGVTGTPQVGVQLTGTDGSASGDPTPTVSSRQWQYSDSGSGAADGDISGATNANYTPSETYVGKYVRRATVWSNTNGTATGYSDWIGPIAAEDEGFVPSYEAFAALSSNPARASYMTDVENWYAANTGCRTGTTNDSSTSHGATTYTGKRFTADTVYPANGTVYQDCIFVGKIDGDGRSFTVDHCTFEGSGAMDYRILGNGTFKYVKGGGSYDCIKTQGDNGLIEWCDIRNPYTSGVDPHNDGIQASGGQSGWIVRNNHIRWADTSEVFFHTVSGWGSPSNVSIYRNWLNGSDLPIRVENVTGSNNYVYENVVQPGGWGWRDFTGSTVNSYGNLNWTTGATLT